MHLRSETVRGVFLCHQRWLDLGVRGWYAGPVGVMETVGTSPRSFWWSTFVRKKNSGLLLILCFETDIPRWIRDLPGVTVESVERRQRRSNSRHPQVVTIHVALTQPRADFRISGGSVLVSADPARHAWQRAFEVGDVLEVCDGDRQQLWRNPYACWWCCRNSGLPRRRQPKRLRVRNAITFTCRRCHRGWVYAFGLQVPKA